MGHDIFAYRKAWAERESPAKTYPGRYIDYGDTVDEEHDEELAYYRSNMTRAEVRFLYIALGAQDHDGGCSGDGKEEFYSYFVLEGALNHLKWEGIDAPKEYLAREIAFFEKILKKCKEEGMTGVWILFS